MSTKEVATVEAQQIDQMRVSIESMQASIDSASAAECNQALSQMNLAKEWARLQQDAEKLLADLLWLEVLALRRIARLDSYAILKASLRPIARAFSGLSDKALREVVDKFGRSSAASTYTNWRISTSDRERYQRGYEALRVPTDPVEQAHWDEREAQERARDTGTSDTLVDIFATRIDDAIDTLIRELPTGRFSTRGVSDLIIDQMGIPEGASLVQVEGFRRGVATAVAESLRQHATPLEVHGLPRFVTVCITDQGRGTDEWVRVPIYLATVGEYRQMLAYRLDQINRLKEIYTDLLLAGSKFFNSSTPNDRLVVTEEMREKGDL
jgi:hypothetical protein